MGMIDHAKRELELAGLFSKESDYEGKLGEAVLELITKFADQGHSGFSAQMTMHLFSELANRKALTPLTGEPEEWDDVSAMSGYPFWQNKRQPSVFSKDGGKTWYDIDEKNVIEGQVPDGDVQLPSKVVPRYEKVATKYNKLVNGDV